MRPLVCSFLALIVFARAQGQWSQSAGPTTHRGVPMWSVFPKGDSLFVGCYEGGAYLSTDNGAHWQERNNGFSWSSGEYTDVNDFLTADQWLIASTSSGVYRSTSSGESWSECNTGLPTPPSMGRMVHLPGLVSGGTEFGVYSSTDNGNTWIADTVGLVRDPSGGITFVRALATLGSVRFAGTFNGVYLSPAPWSRWQEANVGIPIPPGSSSHSRVNSFHVSSSNVFVGTDYGGGIYISTNGGSTWTQRSTGLPTNTLGEVLPIRSIIDWNGALYTSVQDAGMYRSTDFGANWVSATPGYPVAGYSAQMSVANGRLLAPTFEGLFQTTNNGMSWAPLFNQYPTFMTVFSIGVAGNQVLASAYCGHYACDTIAIYRSSNMGASWVQANTPFQRAYAFVLRLAEFYACTESGIYLSTDNGTSWLSRSNGLPNYPVNGLAFQDSVELAVLGGYFAQSNFGGVFKSTDSGNSWGAAGLGNHFMRAIISSSSGNDILASATDYFAVLPPGVYRSSNDGESWDTVTAGLPAYTFVFSFMKRGDAVYAATSSGVYVTSNSGETWAPANSGFEANTGVYGLTQTASAILCATTTGIYISQDEAASWQRINDGFSTMTQTNAIADQEDVCLAATNQGIWRRPLSEITSVPEHTPPEFRLLQNYPNPFNPTTTISFTITRPTYTTLKIYNMLGQEIATLVSGNLSPGIYTKQWNASNVASGVYFYRLQAGDFVQTKKLVVAR